MNWVKMAAILFGFSISLLAAYSDANATMMDIETTPFAIEIPEPEPFAEPKATTAPSEPAAGRSILSRVTSDVGEKTAHGIAPRSKEQIEADALKATIQEEMRRLQSGHAFRQGTGIDDQRPFETSGPSTDGLFGGRGWAILVASDDYYRKAKNTIQQSEKRILSTIASLTHRETKVPGHVTAQGGGGGSKGKVLIGLVLATILTLIIVGAIAASRGK